ncbi:MAG: hypothetical protein MI922_18490, partial [Bacteroidales bacterium]|nr:hypothetical protein [Bacteroidales bacterium]
LLLLILLSFKICIIRSILNKFILFFYALGFLLFIITYFLIRNMDRFEDDGTIAIAAFIVIVCVILVKRMKDKQAKKDYP